VARARSPERDKAFELWKESGGQMPLKDISNQLGQPEGSVRGWKAKDDWEGQLNGTLRKKIRNAPNKKKANKGSSKEQEVITAEESELTEKQRLFCLYYVKCFNATMAAIKAGYAKDSAHVTGPRLLGNARVREYIKLLKGHMAEGLLVDAMDILQLYLKIACSDPTDFVTFGQKEVHVVGPFGPLYEGKGKNKKPVTKIVNFVDFKDSSHLDGSIITEVSQGKDGVKIKFADKMKALEKLERYFDLLPDKWKRKIEEERLKLDREKLSLEKAKVGEPEDTQDDGFMEALEGKLEDAWDGYEDGDDDAEA
jgi:phage terminase small subunit